MLMHQIALAMIVIGAFGFGFSKFAQAFHIDEKAHAEQTAPKVSDPEPVDETWWREIFDKWD